MLERAGCEFLTHRLIKTSVRADAEKLCVGEREREREREGGMGGREGEREREREYSTTRHKLLKLQRVLFMKISGVMHISVVVDATES